MRRVVLTIHRVIWQHKKKHHLQRQHQDRNDAERCANGGNVDAGYFESPPEGITSVFSFLVPKMRIGGVPLVAIKFCEPEHVR